MTSKLTAAEEAALTTRIKAHVGEYIAERESFAKRGISLTAHVAEKMRQDRAAPYDDSLESPQFRRQNATLEAFRTALPGDPLADPENQTLKAALLKIEACYALPSHPMMPLPPAVPLA